MGMLAGNVWLWVPSLIPDSSFRQVCTMRGNNDSSKDWVSITHTEDLHCNPGSTLSASPKAQTLGHCRYLGSQPRWEFSFVLHASQINESKIKIFNIMNHNHFTLQSHTRTHSMCWYLLPNISLSPLPSPTSITILFSDHSFSFNLLIWEKMYIICLPIPAYLILT